MKIDKTKSSSVRKAFGKALTSLGENNNKIVVMDSDLACSTQTKIFADKFPKRFFDCGIAEQDMTATAAGLASEGKIPFIASFAVFATGRNYDQIRNGICYPNFNVKIVGTHGGITVGEDGATHQALEDISLMRGLPHMQVFIPADSKECEEIVKYVAEHDGPMYIRVPRGNAIDIFDENYKFDINKANVLEKGLDIALFTNGETLSQALIAAEELKTENISISVINVPTIKPLDKNTIIDCAKESKFVITVENHSIYGGLGSAVCETLSESYPSKVYRIGINDVFGQSGTAEELMKYYKLDAESLKIRIRELYNSEKEQGNI